MMKTPIPVHKCADDLSYFLNRLYGECEFNIQLVVNIVFIGFKNVLVLPKLSWENVRLKF